MGLSYNEKGWGIVTDFDFGKVFKLVELYNTRELIDLVDELVPSDLEGLTRDKCGVFLLVIVL